MSIRLDLLLYFIHVTVQNRQSHTLPINDLAIAQGHIHTLKNI